MANPAMKAPNFGERNSSDHSFDSISSNLSSGVHSETKPSKNLKTAPVKPVPTTKLQLNGPLKINDSEKSSKITHLHKLTSEKKSIDPAPRALNSKKVQAFLYKQLEFEAKRLERQLKLRDRVMQELSTKPIVPKGRYAMKAVHKS
jgi:hypothetical protein